jgi:hypothetical protein
MFSKALLSRRRQPVIMLVFDANLAGISYLFEEAFAQQAFSASYSKEA